MGHFIDISSNSQLSAKGTALQNEMNGVAVDNPWAMMGVNAVMQLTNFFTVNSNAHVKEENADENWVSNTTNSIKEFNKLREQFSAKPTKQNWDKLENYYNEHKDESSTIKLPAKPTSFQV